LLILLGDLTFMGPCIVSIFQYISKKMQCYTAYLYLETALHVSGGTSTHRQERIQQYCCPIVAIGIRTKSTPFLRRSWTQYSLSRALPMADGVHVCKGHFDWFLTEVRGRSEKFGQCFVPSVTPDTANICGK
jgi:hypothetical protein